MLDCLACVGQIEFTTFDLLFSLLSVDMGYTRLMPQALALDCLQRENSFGCKALSNLVRADRQNKGKCDPAKAEGWNRKKFESTN